MTVSTIGVAAVGVSPIAGDDAHAAPSCTLDPIGTILGMPVTLGWAYASPVSRAQTLYRVRVLSQDGSSVVFDTGYLEGADTSYVLDLALSSGSSYTASVTVSDGYDWSPASTSTFLLDSTSTSTFPDETRVGSVYEVAINGVGYMLADRPDKDGWQRRVIPLDPQRLATGDTPFSEAIDRYTMIGHTDWSDGAGQKLADRDTSSKRAFWSSTGINPFEVGRMQLLPTTSVLVESLFEPCLATVAGGELFVTTETGELSYLADPGDTPAAFTITGCGLITSLCSDGRRWYASDGSNIYTNDDATDPGSAWSASNAKVMAWCSDRLLIARTDGTSTTPNVVAVMNYTTGAENGTPWSYEIETDIRSITSGDGYAWWAAARSDRSVVYAWQLGSADAPFVALELPAGQDIQAVGYYQGNVFVRASEQTTATDKRAIIYRCAEQNGQLSPTRVLDIDDDTVDHSLGAFAGDDRFVYFSWAGMDTESGIGAIDLSTGGWAKWHKATAGTGVVRSIAPWFGRALFTVDGEGASYEAAPVGGNDSSVASGVLTTSVADLGTSMRKQFHRIDLSFDPLPAGATITVGYSTDAGNSFTDLDPVESAGAKFATWPVSAESDTIALRFTLTHGSTTTPVVRSATVRAHPVGIADQVLVLTINCADRVAGMNGRELTESAPGAGIRRAAALEALVQTRVRVQDVDWPITGVAQTYDLVAAESTRVGVFTPHVAHQTHDLHTTLTLRRSYK